MTEDDLGRGHSERFRKVSNRYPLRVTEAYKGDVAAASRDDDETVASREVVDGLRFLDLGDR